MGDDSARYGGGPRGTMQPTRVKSKMEIFTDMQEQMKESASMVDYYTKRKIEAEKVMEEIVGDIYGGAAKKRTSEEGK